MKIYFVNTIKRPPINLYYEIFFVICNDTLKLLSMFGVFVSKNNGHILVAFKADMSDIHTSL